MYIDHLKSGTLYVDTYLRHYGNIHMYLKYFICYLHVLHLCGYAGAVPIHVHVQQEIEYIADFT